MNISNVLSAWRRTSQSRVRFMTRAFDLVATASTAPVWLPVLAIVFVASLLCQGRPVFFLQERVGFRGVAFRVYKFRTMVDNADSFLDEYGMPTQDRVTPFGKVLRRTSIDEIPQVLNFLKGDMSLVGPRPVLIEWMDKIPGGSTHPRFSVRPGLTGQAQVAGRNNVLWSKRLALDTDFASNYSVRRYLRVLLATPAAILRSSVTHDRNASTVDDL